MIFKILKALIELIGWLQIMIAPSLIGFVIGGIVYYNIPTLFGLYIGIGLFGVGVISGIFWATKIYKTTGTINFLSRILKL